MRLLSYVGICLLLLGALIVPSLFTPPAQSDPGDLWSGGGIRFTKASPVPNIIPASPRGMDLGTAAYPVRNVKCINMTMTGTYEVDDLAATDDLTVGDDATITGDTQANGTVTIGGAATLNTTLKVTTQANITRLVLGVGTINATNFSIATAHNASYAVINGNAQNVTLPDPNAVAEGDVVIVADLAGQAASNTIAVNSTNTTGAGNIGAGAFSNITTAYGSKMFQSLQGRWIVL